MPWIQRSLVFATMSDAQIVQLHSSLESAIGAAAKQGRSTLVDRLMSELCAVLVERAFREIEVEEGHAITEIRPNED